MPLANFGRYHESQIHFSRRSNPSLLLILLQHLCKDIRGTLRFGRHKDEGTGRVWVYSICARTVCVCVCVGGIGLYPRGEASMGSVYKSAQSQQQIRETSPC